MGPLVPDVISSEFNLVIALIVGIGFGYVLEQAGFSSTKKLVGLFYGYDFTVLKVFFTAGVTAMIGVLFLVHMDLLNIDLIYINPTFLWSAILGGVIMGAGFIIGGFCPGTSVCAAAAGKIDAMAFIIGSFIGVVAFIELFPFFEGIYYAENWGVVTIYDFFGISPELFAVLLTLIAIGAFWGVTIIQNKVNKTEIVYSKRKITIRSAIVAVSVALILFIAFTPGRFDYMLGNIDEEIEHNSVHFNEVDSDKMAFELSKHGCNCLVIDVRSPEEYKAFHIPLAKNVPLDSMLNVEWKEFFRKNYRKTLFYAEDIKDAKKAYLIAGYLGNFDKNVLIDPASKFEELFMGEFDIPSDLPKHEKELLQFRKRAAEFLIEKENKMKKFNEPVKKKVSRVSGGCA